MTFREWQKKVAEDVSRDMGDFDHERLETVVFDGLFEEAGEVAGLRKRRYRRFERDMSEICHDRVKEELGDLLWYLAAVCCVEGYSLEEIAQRNIAKLEERYGE